MAKCTSYAYSGEATLPVPIAHTGSYAITTFYQSYSVRFALIASNWDVTTSIVLFSSLSYNFSPTHAITFNLFCKANLTLFATTSFVSL